MCSCKEKREEQWEELVIEVGRLHMEIIQLKSTNQGLASENMFLESKIELLQEERDGLKEDVYCVNRKCEIMERDLNKALSLADLSKEGADTPNPFPTKGQQ